MGYYRAKHKTPSVSNTNWLRNLTRTHLCRQCYAICYAEKKDIHGCTNNHNIY